MPERRVIVLSLVERGWQAARRVAIQLTRAGARVHHVVRGKIPAELLEVLTPYAGMTIAGMTPRWYRFGVWLTLLRRHWSRRALVVLVDNERAAGWVARWFPALRASVVVVRETAEGEPVLLRDGSAVDVNTLAALRIE